MRELAEKLTDYVIHKGSVKESQREIYKYGFQSMLETILIVLISAAISVALTMRVEGLLFFLIFIPLRLYAGGLHIKNFAGCLLVSTLVFTAVLLLAKYIKMEVSYSCILSSCFLSLIWMLYPVEHINRPVDKEEKIYFKKKLKQFLLFDFLIVILCTAFLKEKYLCLITITLFMVVVTMILGKIKYRKDVLRQKILDNLYF